MTLQRQLIAAVGLLSVFLGLWAFHEGVLLKAAGDRISTAQRERLEILGDVIIARLEDQRDSLLDGPFPTYTVANETGVGRIVILNRDGTVQIDSKGARSPGDSLPGLGASAEDLEAAWNGDSVVTGATVQGDGRYARYLFRLLSDADGAPLGLVRVTLDVPAPLEASEGILSGFFMKLFGSITFAVILYTALRTIRKKGKGSADPSPQDETMVTTFQGLVRELKDKEQELEELKRRAEQRAEEVESYNENILQSVASGVITFDNTAIITNQTSVSGRFYLNVAIKVSI